MSIQSEVAAYQKVATANSAFNAAEAQKQRDFEANMSSTAHQREVLDLRAAGLNPVLSANNGASTPTGVAAQADTSANSAMATSFSSKRAADAQVKAAQISAGATVAAAAIAANASMNNAKLAAGVQKFSALVGAGSKVSSSLISSLAPALGIGAGALLGSGKKGAAKAAAGAISTLGPIGAMIGLDAVLGFSEYELMKLTEGQPVNLLGYNEMMNGLALGQTLNGMFSSSAKGNVWK